MTHDATSSQLLIFFRKLFTKEIRKNKKYKLRKMVTNKEWRGFKNNRKSRSRSSGTWCQFHQHSMYNFYACRSRKRKKDWQLDCLFTLLGSVRVKSAHGTLVKLTLGRPEIVQNRPEIVQNRPESSRNRSFAGFDLRSNCGIW